MPFMKLTLSMIKKKTDVRTNREVLYFWVERVSLFLKVLKFYNFFLSV